MRTMMTIDEQKMYERGWWDGLGVGLISAMFLVMLVGVVVGLVVS